MNDFLARCNMTTKIYKQGRDAHNNCHTRLSCPYDDQELSEAWYIGWDAAAAQRDYEEKQIKLDFV